MAWRGGCLLRILGNWGGEDTYEVECYPSQGASDQEQGGVCGRTSKGYRVVGIHQPALLLSGQLWSPHKEV